MSETPPNSPVIPDLRSDVEKWRTAREGTLEEWMEKNHDRITKFEGFVRLSWPHKTDVDFVISLTSAEGVRSLREILDERWGAHIKINEKRSEIRVSASPVTVATDADDAA